MPGTALYRQFEEEGRILHREWEKFDLGAVVSKHPRFTGARLHFEKNHAYRRFYSIRSMIRRLGIPKNRGDLIVWIGNLAVRGVLNHKWGGAYRRWTDPDPGFADAPLGSSPKQPVKIEEHDRLVKLTRS